MCAPWVRRHTMIRYSSSCHTRVNIGASIFFTAAMIRAFRSARSRGNGGTNTRSLTYPHRKKSQGVTSGDLGDHSISGWSFPDTRRIQRPGKISFKYWDEPRSRIGRDFGLAEIWTSVWFVTEALTEALTTVRKYVSYGFPIINYCKSRSTLWNALFLHQCRECKWRRSS
jgi:hypothetical protein